MRDTLELVKEQIDLLLIQKDQVIVAIDGKCTSGKAFSYRPFDCSTLTLAAPVTVIPKKLNIVEGTYSHHPYFGSPYNQKIPLTVGRRNPAETNHERPVFLHKRFFEEWIPMENRYFDGFCIQSKSDMKF